MKKLAACLVLMASACIAQPGQLVFSANTTDKVSANAAASINDLNPLTYIAWVYPTTLSATRRISNKGVGSGAVTHGYRIFQMRSGGFIELDVARATADSDFITSSLGCVVNKWCFVAATFDSTQTPNTHLYTGDLSTIAAEPSYSTSTAGSGAIKVEDTGQKFTVGNREAGSVQFQGSISVIGVWNVVLTLSQIQAIQRSWTNLPSGNVLTFGLGGVYGTGSQTDLSGNSNTGTVTTATVGVGGVPLAVPAILGVM